MASDVEIANLARGAGFRDDRPSTDPGQRHSELAVAVAIALAESGGNENAVNSIGATGLWQIYPGNDGLLDPQANANAAWAKYDARGRSFRPWSVFISKAYLPFLVRGEAAVKATHVRFVAPGLNVAPVGEFIGDVAHDVGEFFRWITSGSTWIRLGEAVGGAVLILLALYLLFTKTDTYQRGSAKRGLT